MILPDTICFFFFCNGEITSHFVPVDILPSDVLYPAETIHQKYDFPLEYVKCGVGFTLVLKKIKKDKEKKATATLHEARIS